MLRKTFVVDSDKYGPALILVGRRAKMTHKNRKSEEISCFEVLDVLLKGEGFSCCLDVIHERLGINRQQFDMRIHNTL
jgi:hypothetical protein